MNLSINNLVPSFLKEKTEKNNPSKNDKNTLENNNYLSKNDSLQINEGRKVLKPTGKDNGQNFYFLYTLETPLEKIAMLEVIASNSKITSAGIFPVVGAIFSIKTQMENKSLSDLIKQRY